MKNTLFTALTILILLIGALSINRCTKQAQDSSIAKIDTILQVRHDTIIKIDSVLRTRTRYIDTSRVSVVHDTLNKMIPDTTHDTVIISSNQLRECVKCEDSLKACKTKSSIDSQTIDTISKKSKQKEPTDWQTLGLVGAGGVILGIILTR